LSEKTSFASFHMLYLATSMPTAKKELKINLLPQKEFEKGTLGRTLRWLLSSFRIIVILIDMLVTCAFLSRFWLDAQSSDLDNSIRQKNAIIGSFSEIEKNFEDTQKRLTIFSKATPQDTVSGYVNTVVSFLPSDIRLKSISKSENSLQIVGSSGNEQQIAQFIANLGSSKTFKKVALTQIDSDREDQYAITFTVQINL